MRICICTTPLRPKPTTYPPFGSMAIIQSLRGAGEDVRFFNIDFFRYSHDQVAAYFTEHQFDVVGISAVVSTAYAYTKYLSKLIRQVSPRTIIVVGGNLAASAEILLRKCAVDYCVTGDGELIIRDLIRLLRERPPDREKLRATKGLCFLDQDGKFQFTGYGQRPSAEEIEWPDYSILEADGSLSYFVSERIDDRFFGHTRASQAGEKLATVIMTKGCVARCTFCHRWEKGFRARPVDQIIAHVQQLKDRYNVHFVDVADENFGGDRKLTWELATRLGQMDIAWRAAGVRTRTVQKESLQHWKANGCVSVVYGIESGSEKILKVMEKNATVEENINALKWTHEAGLGTVIQLVLGMPGETDETIRETTEFLKQVAPYQTWWEGKAPSEMISINYAQALPGTPLYEFARERGFIGTSMDEEEEYLIRISDTDAYSEDHFINYTGLPMLKVLTWRPWILAELDAHHLRREMTDPKLSLFYLLAYYAKLVRVRIEKGWGGNSLPARLGRRLLPGSNRRSPASEQAGSYEYISDSGYFNIHKGFKFAPLLMNPLTRRMFYPLLAMAMAIKAGSPAKTVQLIFEHLRWSLLRGRKKAPEIPAKSLRKIVTIVSRRNVEAEDRMLPLRSGR